jgi:hypothetical protein
MKKNFAFYGILWANAVPCHRAYESSKWPHILCQQDGLILQVNNITFCSVPSISEISEPVAMSMRRDSEFVLKSDNIIIKSEVALMKTSALITLIERE